jgi:hypothetical protein
MARQRASPPMASRPASQRQPRREPFEGRHRQSPHVPAGHLRRGRAPQRHRVVRQARHDVCLHRGEQGGPRPQREAQRPRAGARGRGRGGTHGWCGSVTRDEPASRRGTAGQRLDPLPMQAAPPLARARQAGGGRISRQGAREFDLQSGWALPTSRRYVGTAQRPSPGSCSGPSGFPGPPMLHSSGRSAPGTESR